MTEVYADLRFEAAHRLPNVPEGHRCARLHGHSYRVRVTVRGPVDARSGWVVDFAVVEHAAHSLIAQLDHRTLNDVKGLENPTAEHIARWLWNGIEPSLPGLWSVTVEEGQGMGCTYRGRE